MTEKKGVLVKKNPRHYVNFVYYVTKRPVKFRESCAHAQHVFAITVITFYNYNIYTDLSLKFFLTFSQLF